MWERGNRHNPLSNRYKYYLDHRPVLPQDGSLDWLFLRGKVYDPYKLIYITFIINKTKKIILLNNIPTKDREELKTFMSYYETFFKNLSTLAFIPTFLSAGVLYRMWTPKFKILYPVSFFFLLAFNRALIASYFKPYANNYLGYYYYKYSHLAVDDIYDIEDKRRKFFRLDLNRYYRQSHEEILHKSHHDGHHDHEAPYYGPLPVN